MTQGVVVGGWEYVWMAYGLTFAALAIYTATLFSRLRASSPEEPRNRGSRGTTP